MMKRKSGAVVLGIAVMTLLGSCGETTPANESQQTTTKETVTEAVSSAAETQETTVESMIEGSEAESSQAEESSEADEISQTEENSEAVQEDALLRPGFYRFVDEVDTGDEYYRSDVYYQFEDGGRGYFMSQATGEKFDFDYTLTGDELHIVCDNGIIEQKLKLTKNDDGTLDGLVENIGVTKIYYQSGKDLSDFSFFNNDQLCTLAKNFYNSTDGTENPVNGTECAFARAYINDKGDIVLDLYKGYDLEQDLIDTYIVDRTTAKGKDKNGNTIDLTVCPA